MKKALPSFHYLPKRKAETFLLALIKECCKTPWSGDRRGYMPPLLKTKQTQLFPYLALEM